MSRSPLAYPLTRGIDGDSGGAADLQTDIMRFMAILGLCLVAIFALVQSLPMAPTMPIAGATDPIGEQAAVIPQTEQSEPQTTSAPTPSPPVANTPAVQQEAKRTALARPQPAVRQKENPVTLARPKLTPTYSSKPAANTPLPAVALPVTPAAAPAAPEPEGFTLRFESDIALTRLVAAGQIGFYAIESGRAQRMAVSDSRISFWDASTPGAFHEMESATVPKAVIDALARAGGSMTTVDWGVTLPAKLSAQLAELMASHKGGSLIIAADGNLRLESS